MFDFHTLIFGDEECRKTGKWHRGSYQSKDAALAAAAKTRRQGNIIHAIERGNEVVMNEAEINRHLDAA